jgi:hypothetical protein
MTDFDPASPCAQGRLASRQHAKFGWPSRVLLLIAQQPTVGRSQTAAHAMVTHMFRMILPASFICADQSLPDISLKTLFLIEVSHRRQIASRPVDHQGNFPTTRLVCDE